MAENDQHILYTMALVSHSPDVKAFEEPPCSVRYWEYSLSCGYFPVPRNSMCSGTCEQRIITRCACTEEVGKAWELSLIHI